MRRVLAISHNLRTPVTHIIGYADLYKDGIITCDEFAQKAVAAAAQLNLQIDALIVMERAIGKMLIENNENLAVILGYTENFEPEKVD